MGEEEPGEADDRGGENGRAQDGGVELLQRPAGLAVRLPDGHDLVVGGCRRPHDGAATIRTDHAAEPAGARQLA